MEGMEIVGVVLSGIIAFLFWKIKQFEGKDFLTRGQINELIREKTDPIHEDMSELKITISAINEQVVNIGVMLARIDERMKRAE